MPVGLGSHVQWDRKLDGRLAQAVMSIQAIKAVEVGNGFEGAKTPGSRLHDAIFPERETSPTPIQPDYAGSRTMQEVSRAA